MPEPIDKLLMQSSNLYDKDFIEQVGQLGQQIHLANEKLSKLGATYKKIDYTNKQIKEALLTHKDLHERLNTLLKLESIYHYLHGIQENHGIMDTHTLLSTEFNQHQTFLKADLMSKQSELLLPPMNQKVIVQLQADPLNPHDEHAIKVFYQTNFIGYVDRQRASEINDLKQQGTFIHTDAFLLCQSNLVKSKKGYLMIRCTNPVLGWSGYDPFLTMPENQARFELRLLQVVEPLISQLPNENTGKHFAL